MGWLSPTASICTRSAGTPALIRAWATALARAWDFWKITSRCRSTVMSPVRLEEWPITLTVPVPAWTARSAVWGEWARIGGETHCATPGLSAGAADGLKPRSESLGLAIRRDPAVWGTAGTAGPALGGAKGALATGALTLGALA